MKLIFDQKVRCGDWAKARIGVESWGAWYECIGYENDGELVAVAVFENYNGVDVSMHIAAIPGKRWLTREALRAAFRYAFVQLRCRRITGHVPAKNEVAARFDMHIGFTLEGVKREGWIDDDMLIFGMLKRECRYL